MNDAVTIGMAATAVGTVLWFLVKMMIDDFKRSVSGVGSKLDSTIARFDERVTKLEDKMRSMDSKLDRLLVRQGGKTDG